MGGKRKTYLLSKLRTCQKHVSHQIDACRQAAHPAAPRRSSGTPVKVWSLWTPPPPGGGDLGLPVLLYRSTRRLQGRRSVVGECRVINVGEGEEETLFT